MELNDLQLNWMNASIRRDYHGAELSYRTALVYHHQHEIVLQTLGMMRFGLGFPSCLWTNHPFQTHSTL